MKKPFHLCAMTVVASSALALAACGGSQAEPATAPTTPSSPDPVSAEDAPPTPAPPEEPTADPTAEPIPDGFHTVTPALVVGSIPEALTWYRDVFGAETTLELAGPDGEPMHAEMKIGDSIIMLSAENPAQGIRSPETLGGTATSVHLYVEDVDAIWKAATEAGAEPRVDLANMFWGDRFGEFTDPFGHNWGVATHVEDVPAEVMAKRAEKFQKASAAGKKPPEFEIENPAESHKAPGYHTVTPAIVVDGAADAIEFYAKAFGAEEQSRVPAGEDKLMHAEIEIGDSLVMLSDAFPERGSKGPKDLGGTSMDLHLYVEDADAVFEQAVAAGAEPVVPMMDAFWGDRYGQVEGPFGHRWGIATHQEDLTPEQMLERMKEQMGGEEASASDEAAER